MVQQRKPVSAINETDAWLGDLFNQPAGRNPKANDPLVSERCQDDKSINTNPVAQAHLWQTGRRKRVPAVAGLAITTTLILSCTMIVIVFRADGSRTSDWKVSPAVLSAVVATSANILIQMALAQGIAVSWWRRSIVKSSSARDLHSRWVVGQGFFDAIKETILRGPSFAATASIVATIVAVNSPLIQRALTPAVDTFYTYDVDLGSIKIAQSLPRGYSGLWDHDTRTIGFPTRDFQSSATSSLQKYNIHLLDVTDSPNYGACHGTCSTTIRGPGLAWDCKQSYIEYEDLKASPHNFDNFTDVLLSEFRYSEYPNYTVSSEGSKTTMATKDVPRSFTYKSMWKPAFGYPDSEHGMRLQVRECTITPATVEYPVTITNVSIELGGYTTGYDDFEKGRVVSTETIEEMREDVDPLVTSEYGSSTYGGIASFLSRRFDSRVSVKLNNGSWALQSTGLMGYNVMYSRNSTSLPEVFGDPSQDVFLAARDLMFRAAIYFPNSRPLWANQTQRISGTQREVAAIYVANYPFLYAAVAITIITSLLITPLFYGFADLGRKVSMSPLEVAKAFDPVHLREAASNSDADGLLRSLGNKQINYGIGHSSDQDDSSTLIMGAWEAVQRPKPGTRIER